MVCAEKLTCRTCCQQQQQSTTRSLFFKQEAPTHKVVVCQEAVRSTAVVACRQAQSRLQPNVFREEPQLPIIAGYSHPSTGFGLPFLSDALALPTKVRCTHPAHVWRCCR